MQKDGRVPVQFDQPPVIEVACGVAFTLPKPLKTAHIGRYWSRIVGEFPRCDDAAPIAMIVEGQGTPDSTDLNVQFDHMALPPMRRAWLINAEGTHLLQLQEDRFLFNWKRTGEISSYPSYRDVVADFREQWSRYKAFLGDEGLGTPSPTQLEMTYFNFWPGGTAWLRDYQRDQTQERFLEAPEAVSWKVVHNLPESRGRLHISAGSARHATSNEKGVRLDLTARGLPTDPSDSGCEQWFDLAHVWITQGFTDITTDEAHKAWGRTA